MKIEHCEWSKPNGEDNEGNTIWYCAKYNKDKTKSSCPYDCCEMPPAKPKAVKKVEEIIVERIQVGNMNAYNYDHIYDVSKRHNELFKEAIKLTETEQMTGAELAIRLGISIKTIRKLEKEYGVKFKLCSRNIDWSKYDDKIKAMLADGIQLTEICKGFGLKIATVYNHLYTYNKGA